MNPAHTLVYVAGMLYNVLYCIILHMDTLLTVFIEHEFTKSLQCEVHTEQPSFHVSVYKQHLYVVWYLACIYLVSRMLFRKESFHCILVTVCL